MWAGSYTAGNSGTDGVDARELKRTRPISSPEFGMGRPSVHPSPYESRIAIGRTGNRPFRWRIARVPKTNGDA